MYIDWWMDKQTGIYSYTGKLFNNIKKNSAGTFHMVDELKKHDNWKILNIK